MSASITDHATHRLREDCALARLGRRDSIAQIRLAHRWVDDADLARKADANGRAMIALTPREPLRRLEELGPATSAGSSSWMSHLADAVWSRLSLESDSVGARPLVRSSSWIAALV